MSVAELILDDHPRFLIQCSGLESRFWTTDGNGTLMSWAKVISPVRYLLDLLILHNAIFVQFVP